MAVLRCLSFHAVMIFLVLFISPASGASVVQNTTPVEERTVRLFSIEINNTPEIGRTRLKSLLGLAEGESYSTVFIAGVRDTLENRLHRESGRFFAHVTSYNLLFSADSGSVSLIVTVDIGPPAIVDTVMIRGPLGGREPEVRSLLWTQSGEPFDPETWDRDLLAALNYFEEAGFPFARVLTRPLQPDFRESEVGVRVGMEIFPGRAVEVSRIEISGLKKTKPKIARRILSLEVGRRFSPLEAEKARQRLLRTGWFSEVKRPRLFRDVSGRFGLVYEVMEQPTSFLSGAVGYTPKTENEGGLSGALDARFANLLGTGRELFFGWRRDDPRRQFFMVRYREPYLLGAPLDMDISFSQDTAESLYVSLEFSAGVTWRAGDVWRIGGSVIRRKVTADSLAADSGSYSLLGGEATVALETFDNSFNPSSGGRYEIRGSRLLPLRGSSLRALAKSGLDLEHAVTLRRGWVGFSGVHYRDTRTDRGSPPYAEWSRVGGIASVRGFVEGSLIAPRAGWSNLEIRRLMGGKNRVFLLTDIVALDLPTGTDWKSSFGVGAQLETPVGLITSIIALPAGFGIDAAVVHAKVTATF